MFGGYGWRQLHVVVLRLSKLSVLRGYSKDQRATGNQFWLTLTARKEMLAKYPICTDNLFSCALWNFQTIHVGTFAWLSPSSGTML